MEVLTDNANGWDNERQREVGRDDERHEQGGSTIDNATTGGFDNANRGGRQHSTTPGGRNGNVRQRRGSNARGNNVRQRGGSNIRQRGGATFDNVGGATFGSAGGGWPTTFANARRGGWLCSTTQTQEWGLFFFLFFFGHIFFFTCLITSPLRAPARRVLM
jgi:hypothetical protein